MDVEGLSDVNLPINAVGSYNKSGSSSQTSPKDLHKHKMTSISSLPAYLNQSTEDEADTHTYIYQPPEGEAITYKMMPGRSNRGHTILYSSLGHTYTLKDRKNKDGTKSFYSEWQCSVRNKTIRCPGKFKPAVTIPRSKRPVSLRTEHICQVKPKAILAKEMAHLAKRMGLEMPEKSARELAEAARQEIIENSGLHLQEDEIPTDSQITVRIQYARCQLSRYTDSNIDVDELRDADVPMDAVSGKAEELDLVTVRGQAPESDSNIDADKLPDATVPLDADSDKPEELDLVTLREQAPDILHEYNLSNLINQYTEDEPGTYTYIYQPPKGEAITYTMMPGRSNRGHAILCSSLGHTYTLKDRKNKDGTKSFYTEWQCSVRNKTMRCPGKFKPAVTIPKSKRPVSLRTEHKCQAKPKAILAKEMAHLAKRMGLEIPEKSARELAEAARQEIIENSGLHLQDHEIPTVHQISERIHYARCQLSSYTDSNIDVDELPDADVPMDADSGKAEELDNATLQGQAPESFHEQAPESFHEHFLSQI